MAGSPHAVRFSQESAQYRTARDRLLDVEVALRRQIEQVAALRRQLPLGGPVTEDYVFEETGPVRLSELFGKHDTLVLYSFMYGPAMKQACSSCTSILDGLDGEAPHVTQRVALAVVAKSPIERIRAFAEQGGGAICVLSPRRRIRTIATTTARPAMATRCRPSTCSSAALAGSTTSTTPSCCMPRETQGRTAVTWI